MARIRRKRTARDGGMSPFTVGVIALVIVLIGCYFGFTKANPFSNPYELHATFETASNLKPNSPVRIAGVDVGKVTDVEPFKNGQQVQAKVTMEIQDKGLPIHSDAQLKVRPRIFLEGNYFVDMKPGSPAAPKLNSGGTIPPTQTAGPVQFGDLLAALQKNTREDLQTFLYEYSKGLDQGGAEGFNQSIKYWEAAYKNSSLANQASLGEDPAHDLQRVLKGQASVARALSADEGALQNLVTNFNVTAGAFASQDQALSASIPALRDLLHTAQPALKSLNDSLPSLRAFAREALPGVKSSDPALAASLPFIEQARLLVGPNELRGAVAVLRLYLPSLVKLNDRSVSVLDQGRQLSACTTKELVPFLHERAPEPELPSNNQPIRMQIQHGFPALSGESRLSDGINQYFHIGSVGGAQDVRPGPPPDGGDQPPPHRPDQPCENQELPNLNAPGGPITSFGARGPNRTPAQFAAAVAKAKVQAPRIDKLLQAEQLRAQGKDDQAKALAQKLGVMDLFNKDTAGYAKLKAARAKAKAAGK